MHCRVRGQPLEGGRQTALAAQRLAGGWGSAWCRRTRALLCRRTVAAGFGSFHLRMHPSLVFVRRCCLRNVGASRLNGTADFGAEPQIGGPACERCGEPMHRERVAGKHEPLACKVHVRRERGVATGGSGAAIAVAGWRCGVRALTGAIARFVRRITLICSHHRLRSRLQSAFVQSKLLFYPRKDAETLVDGAE